MIIYNIKGEKIQDVLVTKGAVHEEELMKKNLIRLSWSNVEKRHYPVGTYIKPFADKGDDTPYFLFQPYDPEQVNEVEYKYAPEFQHPTMYLGYVPYVNKTKNYDGQDITKLDWSYVGGTAELLADVCKAINAALKDANLLSDEEEFKAEVISTNNVAIKDTTNVTFASVDILSALNQIAQYNECEWHLAWEDKTLYFGDITIGDDVDEVILQVDENVGVASIRNDKEGFWNVFYPQGGTKNMTRQMSADEYIHSNERLMLDKTAYPDGMIYTDENGNVKTAEEFAALGQKKIVKVLTFEDIYPKLTLYMYRLRERLRTRFKDDEHTDPYITGTDENGNPIYEKYADWYFRLAYPVKDENGNIIDWKDFDGLTARTPKALIQNVNENKVRLRVPFVAGKDFYTNSDGTVTATIDDVSVVATIGGLTGDAAQPDLTIEKITPNYGRFMQKVIDGATDMALSAGIDTAVWCECAATRGELDEYTYTKSLIVNGEKIGAAFGVNPNSDAYQSRLAGREFELDYYDTKQTIEKTEHDSGVQLEPGDYHIIREDGDIIIPTTSNGGIYPQADWDENIKNNTLSLFNIVMTDDYKKSAQNDLANATLQEIKYYHTDLRTYTVKSKPVAFAKKNPNLYIGRKVTYKDLKGYTLKTRVMALTTQLDYPIEQTISVGNIVIKGTQQQLKEDVKTIISGNGGGGGTLNKSAVESIIKQYSDKRYLSKLNDDTAKGEITFEKGAKFGQSNGINEQGNATLNDVTANRYKGKNGVVNLDGDTDISGDANIDKSLDVTKNLLVGGDTNISGSAEVGGDATIARQTTTKTAKVKESLEIGDYQEGDFGYGGKMYVDENGNSHIVVDHAVFRKKAEFNEITVKELKHVGGVIVLSAAAMIASRVEKVDGGWKCYFKNTDSDGNRILNEFVVGDMVRCQTFNMGDSDATTRFLTLGETYIRVGDSLLTANSIPLNRYYWRTLTEVGTDYIVMSETDCDPSVENDEPMVGDNIVLFGSKASLKRQNVIILSAYGKDAPSRKVFQGINDYTLVDKLVYGEYFDYTTNKSKSVMYGDSYVGKRDESTYVKYTTENGVEVKGKMHIERGSTGASNLTDFGDEMLNNAQKLVQGKYNLIRNSGFTGDYVTDILFESTVQNPDSEMYSPPLDHWAIGVGTATVNDSVISESGKEVALLSCSLSQTLESPLIKGENYILSLKAKGAMDMSLNIYNNSNEERNYVQFDLTESWGKYTYSFVASDNHTHITFWSSDCSMCEIQLERGNIPSAWGRSFLDNQTTLAYYKSLTYLSDAIANGSTDVLGGLILTSMINLGNYKDGKLVKSTAGTSGVYNDDDDVAFWAGGSLEQAIALVTKIKANPKYQPTIEEWVNLAKYVVTHGGDTIMKGTIFADNGYFRGRLEAKEGYFNGEVSIANGKIQMNTDGSGHLANGNISWDKNGKTTINSSINAENLYRGICIVWGWEVPNSGGQLYGKYKYLNLDKEGNYKEYCYIKGLDRLQAIANSIEWTSDENGEEVEVTDEMRNEWLKFYNIGTYIVWNGSPLHKVGVSLDEVNSDEVLRCTYNADFIQLVDGSKRYGKGFPEQGSVYLPRPQDFKGKMVEVDHASTTNTKVTDELGNTYDTNAWVKCVDGIFYLDTIYNENTNDIEVQVNSGTGSVNIASGSIARFYSLGSVWLVMSRKEALKKI